VAPAGQAAQAVALAQVPARHTVHAAAPTGAAVPAWHGVQRDMVML
jgi:hypothetical protein